MSTSNRDRNDKYIANTRNYIDVAMGCLYICIGIYMLKIPTLAEKFGASSVYVFLGLFCAYGLYRMGKGLYGIIQAMKGNKPRRHL